MIEVFCRDREKKKKKTGTPWDWGVTSSDTNYHTPNIWLACAVPRNLLGQPSQCPTPTNTRTYRALPNLYFNSLAKAPTWSGCSMLSLDPILNNLALWASRPFIWAAQGQS